jgi:DNA-binding transcriptional ArsR family regulator
MQLAFHTPELAMETDRRQFMASEDGSVSETVLDDMFHALSDSTRRDIVRRCLQESLSMSQLAAGYPMSFAAVQKHIMVLERAGLVSRTRRGREQLVNSEIAALHRARQALDKLESVWRGRIDRMANLLDDMTLDGKSEEGSR